MEIKYEPVFGPQELFIDAKNSTIQQLYDALLTGDLPVPVKDAKK